MPTPARVVVLPQDEPTLRLMDIQLPDPSPYEVVVQQFATGLCHSQLHQIHSPTPRESALLIGHESTGVVVAKGGRVKHVKEGDRVMTTWLPRDLATADHTPERTWYTLPDGTEATTGRTFMFTFGDNVIADEQHVVPLPDDVPTDVTAIIGCPVMTGAGAVRNTAGVQAGQSVAVFGAGGVGLAAIAAAAVIGATPIIAVDVAEDKLAFAKRFGATIGVDGTASDPVEQNPRTHERRRGLRFRLHGRHRDHAADAGRDEVRGMGRRPRRDRRLGGGAGGAGGPGYGGKAVRTADVPRLAGRLQCAGPGFSAVPGVVPRGPAGPDGAGDAALSAGGDQRGVCGAGAGRNSGAGDHRAVGAGVGPTPHRRPSDSPGADIGLYPGTVPAGSGELAAEATDGGLDAGVADDALLLRPDGLGEAFLRADVPGAPPQHAE